MLATASSRARVLPLFLAWCAWSVLNVVLMWLGPGLETVPFHLIWVSLAIVYGLQAWPLRWAVTACVVVAVATGIPLTSHAEDGVIAYEEVTEIPLMSVLFLVMVWHVRRRTAAVEEARRSAEREHVATRLQQRFVRLASHELRTPITVARGYTEQREDYLLRLCKVEGQVRGIAHMVAEDRYCLDVLTQVAAVNRALQEVALGLLDDHVRHCVLDAARTDPADGEAKMAELSTAIRRAMRL